MGSQRVNSVIAILCDPDEDGEAAHKLLLTQTDKETLLAIIGQKT